MPIREDALSALVNLGYKKSSAEAVRRQDRGRVFAAGALEVLLTGCSEAAVAERDLAQGTETILPAIAQQKS
ncbi:MAG: hypothetical protein MZU91_04460 [Desulfosudis oleivorans]|nr:hypothetical protein [Desulfosudis oleivorans]